MGTKGGAIALEMRAAKWTWPTSGWAQLQESLSPGMDNMKASSTSSMGAMARSSASGPCEDGAMAHTPKHATRRQARKNEQPKNRIYVQHVNPVLRRFYARGTRCPPGPVYLCPPPLSAPNPKNSPFLSRGLLGVSPPLRRLITS